MATFEEFPELEHDIPRQHIVIAMLEEFPSVRFQVEAWLKDEHADELA